MAQKHETTMAKFANWEMHPNASELHRQIRFWREQSLTRCDDKGGSFNVDLYMRYLEAKWQTT